MPTPISVVTADWHLEKSAWAKHPTLCNDSFFALQQITDYCIQNDLPLIGAGDLFNETHPESYPVWFASNQMERMRLANLPVYFIQGQHEKIRERPWLSMHDWPTYVHMTQFELRRPPSEPLKLYGLDFTTSDKIKDRLLGIPKGTDILVAHQVWQDLMGKAVGPECAIADVPHVKMVISGDYHSHTTIVAANADNEKCVLVSPGSTCMQSVAEPPTKWLFVLNDDLSLTSVKLKSRGFYSWDILDEIDLNNFLTNSVKTILQRHDLPPELVKPIVRIRFNSELSTAFDSVSEAVGEKAHLFISPLKTMDVDRLDSKLANQSIVEKGLVGCLELFIDSSLDEYSIAKRLLESENPIAELEALEVEKQCCLST